MHPAGHSSGEATMESGTAARTAVSRRRFLITAGVMAGGASVLEGPWVRRADAQSGALRIGFQVRRTGIGAVYGRWYERTTAAAVALINEKGGIGGRQVEIVAED